MQVGTGNVELRNDNGLATLVLRGDFDIGNVPMLDAAVRDCLWPSADVLVDLRDVTFMDGRLLRWLIELRRDLRARGGRMPVRPGRPAHRLLGALPRRESFELVDASAIS